MVSAGVWNLNKTISKPFPERKWFAKNSENGLRVQSDTITVLAFSNQQPKAGITEMEWSPFACLKSSNCEILQHLYIQLNLKKDFSVFVMPLCTEEIYTKFLVKHCPHCLSCLVFLCLPDGFESVWTPNSYLCYLYWFCAACSISVFVISKSNRGLHYERGFGLTQATSGLTLGFPYCHHGNLCCRPNPLQSRSCS